MTENNVDPKDPRPKGHYSRFADNEWHLSQTCLNYEEKYK